MQPLRAAAKKSISVPGDTAPAAKRGRLSDARQAAGLSLPGGVHSAPFKCASFSFLARRSPRLAPSFGPLHENRKAKPAGGSGGDVDAMAQNSGAWRTMKSPMPTLSHRDASERLSYSRLPAVHEIR
jgi:hypothetical protein